MWSQKTDWRPSLAVVHGLKLCRAELALDMFLCVGGPILDSVFEARAPELLRRLCHASHPSQLGVWIGDLATHLLRDIENSNNDAHHPDVRGDLNSYLISLRRV